MKFSFQRPWQVGDHVFYVGRRSPTGDDCVRSGKIIKKSDKAKGWWLVSFFGGRYSLRTQRRALQHDITQQRERYRCYLI